MKSNIDYEGMGLDPLVIPLVKFFNDEGLKTNMSCQGHNKTNMSMFWISFADEITTDDVLRFMQNHLNWCGQFVSYGRFAKRIFGGYSVKDRTWKTTEHWCYFAATVEAADEDLLRWTRSAEWQGVGDQQYMAWIEKLKHQGQI